MIQDVKVASAHRADISNGSASNKPEVVIAKFLPV